MLNKYFYGIFITTSIPTISMDETRLFLHPMLLKSNSSSPQQHKFLNIAIFKGLSVSRQYHTAELLNLVYQK